MPRLFHYSEEAFDRMCEGLDAFLHKTYGEPPQALEEGDTACVLCRHPMSITSPEFQFVDEAMSVHAQCACFAQMSWMPTREMLTKVVAKRKSSSCVQCNESTPFVTCVGCALLQNDKTKCFHLTCAIKAQLYLRWDPYQFDVLCRACYVKRLIPKHLKKATWITVKYMPDNHKDDDDDDDDAGGGDVKQKSVDGDKRGGGKRGGGKKRPADVTFEEDKPDAGGGKKGQSGAAAAAGGSGGGGGGKKGQSGAAAAAAAGGSGGGGGGKKGPAGGKKKKPALRATAAAAAIGGCDDSDVSEEAPTELYTPSHTPLRRGRSGSPLDGLAAAAQSEPVQNQMQMSVPSAAAAVEFDGALVREPIEKISLPPPEGDAKNESEEEEEVVQPKHKRRKVDYRLLEIASPPRRASTRITPDVPVALRVQQKNRAAAAAAAAAAFSAIIKH